jgi:flagellar hook-associated protein 1 FlgK
MSLNSILSSSVTGLQTAQTGINTVSNNVANLNTAGYQREVINQQTLVVAGATEGVTPGEISRVTDQYLQGASLQASASAGSAAIVSNLLDQAQSAFGDPSTAGSYLNQLSTVFSDFAAAANNPSSNLSRNQAVGDLSTFLDTTQQVSGALNGLTSQADGQINDDVGQINQLLSQISGLNGAIAGAQAGGVDATGAQNTQSQLLTQLSSLISIKVSTQSNGVVVVRSTDGTVLAGNAAGPATLSYSASPTTAGAISITQPGAGGATSFNVGDGELQGLLTLRNTQLPAIQTQLAEYVSTSVSALNAAHNANTTSPPPQTLQGRDTGLDLPTIIGDFSGTTNIAVVDSSGQLQQQVSIDFTADTMSVNGGGPTSFDPTTFLDSLNTALGGTATASFTNGALSLTANAGSGVAIADDPTTPATDGGQGFSQFFGLNDLVTSSQIANYNTGLKATDANGFNAGGAITLQIADSTGAPVTNVSVSVPAGGTMQDLLSALNSPTSGVGLYGTFSLDSNGAMTFSPAKPGGASIAVVSDTTQRGANGPSMTELFGIGAAQRAGRSGSFQIRSDIAANSQNLALGQLDLSAGAGNPVTAAGDGSGALALAAAGNASVSFAAAGALPATSTSLTQYAANLAGDLGQRATLADNAKTTAQAVQTEATSRLSSATGVNLDQELINLTTYQQAYSASAQLIQATKTMYNALLSMVS